MIEFSKEFSIMVQELLTSSMPLKKLEKLKMLLRPCSSQELQVARSKPHTQLLMKSGENSLLLLSLPTPELLVLELVSISKRNIKMQWKLLEPMLLRIQSEVSLLSVKTESLGEVLQLKPELTTT